MQEAIPEVASEPVTATATARLYQPFASGGRAGAMPVTCGGVASRRIVTWSVRAGSPLNETEQLTGVPAVSVEM